MRNTLFKETQRYENKMMLAFLGLFGIAAIAGGINYLLEPEVNYYNATFLFLVAISIGVLIWWLSALKLKVEISEKKIKFKLSPIHFKKRSIEWREIDKCEIVKTPEVAQWSGQNISYSTEKTISLTGRNGLAIITKNGLHYFIGCKNIAELRQVLDELNPKQLSA